jgi:hypothetical protein
MKIAGTNINVIHGPGSKIRVCPTIEVAGA